MKTTDLLIKCAQELDAGTSSVDDIVARYPGQRSELAPLLQLHLKLEALPTRIVLSEPTKARVRAQLLAEIRESRAAAKPTIPERLQSFLSQSIGVSDARRYFARPVAIAVTLLLSFGLVGAGTVSAAMESGPGDGLYPLKEATEQARVAFAFTDTDRADAYLWIASTRVRDLSKIADNGRLDLAEKLVDDYNRNLAEALRLASVQKQDNVKFQEQVTSVQTDLHEIYDKAPQELQIHLAQTLSVGTTAASLAPTSVAAPASTSLPDGVSATGVPQGLPVKDGPPIDKAGGSPEPTPTKGSPISTEPFQLPVSDTMPAKGNTGPVAGPVPGKEVAPVASTGQTSDEKDLPVSDATPPAQDSVTTKTDGETPEVTDSKGTAVIQGTSTPTVGTVGVTIKQ